MNTTGERQCRQRLWPTQSNKKSPLFENSEQ
jgi:hypothetical protein